MRHERIHAMQCRCAGCTDLCHPNNIQASAVDPADLAAIRKGVVLALFFGGCAAARQYAPTIFDWIAQ